MKEASKEVGGVAKRILQKKPGFVYLVGRGSSENAGRYGQYVLGAEAGFPVMLGNPSLFTKYKKPIKFGNAVVMAISQSGESPDILTVVEEAKHQKCFSLAITSNSSPLSEIADATIDIRTKDSSIPASKTYLNSLAAIAMLASKLAGRLQLEEELKSVPDLLFKALDSESETKEIAPWWCKGKAALVLSRGYNYSTAHEIALKLKELSYILAHPYSAAEFLHGPIAVIEEGFPVLIVAAEGALLADLIPLAKRVIEEGARLLVISNGKIEDWRAQEKNKSCHLLEFPSSPEWLSPLLAVVPGQFLALHGALSLGLDPDSPRRLQKVTKTG
ncbi:MAG: SIS domain-containing protein [Actinomycetota bacterium]|nr:SIS domain-containing protein [Actinomycetota bacterium]